MHTQIFISKSFFISIFLFLAGWALLTIGNSSREKYENALDFHSSSAEEYVEGSYVVGEIDSYLVKEVNTSLGTTYSGQSEKSFQFLTKYVTYTIPIEGERYVRIVVRNKGNINKLEQFVQGRGNAVEFEGIVCAAEDLNEEWYQDIEGFETEAILPDVVIKEANIDDRVKMYSPGIGLILMGLICFVCGDAIEIFHDKKEEEIYQHEE